MCREYAAAARTARAARAAIAILTSFITKNTECSLFGFYDYDLVELDLVSVTVPRATMELIIPMKLDDDETTRAEVFVGQGTNAKSSTNEPPSPGHTGVTTTSQYLRTEAAAGGSSGDAHKRYPYVVLLEYPMHVWSITGKPDRNCTGSLLSGRWALTAARCLQPPPRALHYSNITLPPDISNENIPTLYTTVLETFSHPNYFRTEGHLKNDIGLILVQKVSLDVYGSVSAIDFRTLMGLPMGYVSYGGSRTRQRERAVVVPCGRAPPLARWSAHPVLCVAEKCRTSKKATTRAVHVPGAPLLLEGRIVGVGAGAAVNGRAAFTAVSPFLDWIWTLMAKYDNFLEARKTTKC